MATYSASNDFSSFVSRINASKRAAGERDSFVGVAEHAPASSAEVTVATARGACESMETSSREEDSSLAAASAIEPQCQHHHVGIQSSVELGLAVRGVVLPLDAEAEGVAELDVPAEVGIAGEEEAVGAHVDPGSARLRVVVERAE